MLEPDTYARKGTHFVGAEFESLHIPLALTRMDNERLRRIEDTVSATLANAT